jgi:sulfur relay (sulfurtransferase) complex TusBCD TusD component (DsrE family)
MKLGIILYSNEPEIAYNAFRFANFSTKQGDETTVFLLNKGVESEYIDDTKFPAVQELLLLREQGGIIYACESCLKARDWDLPRYAHKGNLATLQEIVKNSDKVVSF